MGEGEGVRGRGRGRGRVSDWAWTHVVLIHNLLCLYFGQAVILQYGWEFIHENVEVTCPQNRMSSRVLRKLQGDKDLGIPGALKAADEDSDGASDTTMTFTGESKKKANINPFDLVRSFFFTIISLF